MVHASLPCQLLVEQELRIRGAEAVLLPALRYSYLRCVAAPCTALLLLALL